MLSKLLKFYGNSALPYLIAAGKPTPAMVADVGLLQADLQQYEFVLPYELCQSRVAGRNGSNACAMICTVFVQRYLSGAAGQNDENVRHVRMCEAMSEGNRLYDLYNIVGYLSVDEVFDKIKDVKLHMAVESFVRPWALNTIVDFLTNCAREASTGMVGGILVIHQVSFAVVCHLDTIILFDSHSHGMQGALLAEVPCAHALS